MSQVKDVWKYIEKFVIQGIVSFRIADIILLPWKSVTLLQSPIQRKLTKTVFRTSKANCVPPSIVWREVLNPEKEVKMIDLSPEMTRILWSHSRRASRYRSN